MRKIFSVFLVLILSFSATVYNIKPVKAENIDNNGYGIELRVMSYNIHYGSDVKNKYNLEGIADVIKDSGAEVIGLQEVDVHWGSRSNFENEIRLIAEKLDMNYFFAPIYSLDPVNAGEPRREFGVAVLSKYPILEAVNHDITRLSTQVSNPDPAPSPGFLEVLINVKGVHLPVYVTHLDYRSDPKIRSMQVSDMIRVMGSNHREKILLGDMNATPAAVELAPLFSMFNDTVSITGNDSCLTFPSNAPRSRIDYILTTDGIRVDSTKTINSQASDHLPIISDIFLYRGRQN